jgi:hypothetical protein
MAPHSETAFIDGTGDMKTFLEWCGTLALAALIVAIGGFAGLAQAGGQLDGDSKAYAEAAVNAIAPNWNSAELVSRGAPEIALIPPNQVAAMFARFSHLGPDARLAGCKGQSNLRFMLNQPASITAGYICQLDLQSGPALVTLTLRKDNDAWRIAGFRVDSPLLADQA